MMGSLKFRCLILFVIMLIAVVCDQATKQLARIRLGELGSVPIPGGFGELRLAHNPGSFLSLGESLPESLRTAIFTIATSVALLAMLVYILGYARLTLVPFIGMSMLLGGGASNLIDRVGRKGLVTDFIYLRAGWLHTGVFNVADVAIMAGIAIFAVTSWKSPKSPKPQPDPASGVNHAS